MAALQDLDAITRRYFIPNLVDNVFGTNPLFVKLWKNRRTADGGIEIICPVMLATPTGAQSYSGAEVLPLVFDTTDYGARFNWCNYTILIGLTGEEDYKNGGEAQVVNLVQSKLVKADLALRKDIGEDLQLDGTGNSSKNILGLAAAIDDGTNVTTYGQISRTTFTNWGSQYSANGGVGRALTMSLLNNMFGLCSKDNDKPDLLVTTRALHSKYLELLQPHQRFASDSQLASAGFNNILYMGRPVVVDDNVAANRMWFINSNYLHLYVQGARTFRFSGFQMLPMQDAAVAKLLVSMQLICDSPRMSGQLRDADASL